MVSSPKRLLLVGSCAALLAACDPAVTGQASDVGSWRATLHGEVAPGDVRWSFEYGRSTSYGSDTPVQEDRLAEPTPVQEVITGLQPATTYHYRLCVQELVTFEQSCGADATFTTAPRPTGIGPRALAGDYSGTLVAVTDHLEPCIGNSYAYDLERETPSLGTITVRIRGCIPLATGQFEASATFSTGHGLLSASGSGWYEPTGTGRGSWKMVLGTNLRNGVFWGLRPGPQVLISATPAESVGPATATVAVK